MFSFTSSLAIELGITIRMPPTKEQKSREAKFLARMKYEENEEICNTLLSGAEPFYREMVRRQKIAREKVNANSKDPFGAKNRALADPITGELDASVLA